MNKEDLKQHWENVYTTKQPNEVSWTQEKPQTSLDFLYSLNLPKDAKIIDIGGGDSKLVDFLLEEGYTNITVLDISGKALERAQKRLGEKAKMVKWVESNVLDINPTETYDFWHDRAAFHFLTSEDDKLTYSRLLNKAVRGYALIATFSTSGPLKCSGLEIQQYNGESLQQLLGSDFTRIEQKTEDHTTPFDTKQNFLFACFKRRVYP
jgi:SAM-dependent methyltransferase